MFRYPLYGEDGQPDGVVIGFDGDGCPILDNPDEARRHPWDYDAAGEAGEDLGPCDPIDDLDDEPEGGFALLVEPDSPFDFEADDGQEFGPCYEDMLWWAEHGHDTDR